MREALKDISNLSHPTALASGGGNAQGGCSKMWNLRSLPNAHFSPAAPQCLRVEHPATGISPASLVPDLSSFPPSVQHAGIGCPDRLKGNTCGFPLSVVTHHALHASDFAQGPPVLDYARNKPKAKSAAFRMGAAPFQPSQTRHPGLNRPLSQAGHFKVEQPCSQALSASFPSPFTSFDAVNGPRVLAGEPEWTSDRYIIHALDTARLPGNPLPRFLRFELIDFPGPQVVITLDHGVGNFRAVVFDFRPLHGEVEVIDVPPTTTFVEQVRASRSIQDIDKAVDVVTGHACTTLLNGVIVAPGSNVPQAADLVLFKLWQDGTLDQTWRPFQFGDMRPPVPPIPQDAHVVHAAPESNAFVAASSSHSAALPRGLPVTAFAPEPRYSYMGVFEGVQNRPKPSPPSDHACVQDVLSFLPRRGEDH